MTTLNQLHKDRDRINAMLDDPFVNDDQVGHLFDQLSKICDRIDSLEMSEAERSVKIWMDHNTVPL